MTDPREIIAGVLQKLRLPYDGTGNDILVDDILAALRAAGHLRDDLPVQQAISGFEEIIQIRAGVDGGNPADRLDRMAAHAAEALIYLRYPNGPPLPPAPPEADDAQR